jgi:hypothetical protein
MGTRRDGNAYSRTQVRRNAGDIVQTGMYRSYSWSCVQESVTERELCRDTVDACAMVGVPESLKTSTSL